MTFITPQQPAPHSQRQYRRVSALFSIVGILQLCGCGVLFAQVNPFDAFLNRFTTIKVAQATTATVDRETAKLTEPIKFKVSGALPTGEIDSFALLQTADGRWWIGRQAWKNPFDKLTGYIAFVTYFGGDRLVPYTTGKITGTIYTFEGYAALKKAKIIDKKVKLLLFGLAPKGEAQMNNFARACAVMVNLK
jgi:hypothetical protein